MLLYRAVFLLVALEMAEMNEQNIYIPAVLFFLLPGMDGKNYVSMANVNIHAPFPSILCMYMIPPVEISSAGETEGKPHRFVAVATCCQTSSELSIVHWVVRLHAINKLIDIMDASKLNQITRLGENRRRTACFLDILVRHQADKTETRKIP